jgi:hypothetical protein
VGPLSYICGKYGEAFNPDSIGTIDNISLQNITFSDKTITDKSKLISTVNKRQDDYGFISIGKGCGFGIVGKVDLTK